MALDTSGSDANAYVDEAEADAYWAARNNSTWAGATTAAKEAAIIEATQYIDATFRDRFVGYIRSTSQALEWPRVDAYDRSGRHLTGIPQVVKDATCEFALAALSGPLVPVLDRGGDIKRTRVKAGPVETETEYMDGAPSSRTYDYAARLLSAVLKSGGHGLVRV